MTSDNIGIIVGHGQLPILLMKELERKQLQYYAIAVVDRKHDKIHDSIDIAKVGKLLSLLEKHQVHRVVFAGKIHRPKFSSLIPDAKGLSLLKRIMTLPKRGDDSLLRTINEFLQEHNIDVVALSDLLPIELASVGYMGKIKSNKRDEEDIKLAVEVAKAIGPFDIGQAVVVKDGVVIAVEAIEGTDNMLERIVPYIEPKTRGGILVKILKSGQDRNSDLPAIGVNTIELVHKAGLAGIALQANHSFIVEKKSAIALADKLKIFVKGIVID